VYVAGDTSFNENGKRTACCWKNGQPTNLANGGLGSGADAIAILGNNICVGGFYGAQYTSGQPLLGKAVYWKNGVTVQLSSDTSNVSGLATGLHY